jgi:hypothetical protein
MEIIKDLFREKRSNLTESSLNTYYSLLSKLHKDLYGTSSINLKNFKNTKKIMEFLQSKQPNTRRTILSALFVITDEPIYREEMMREIENIKKETEKQEKNEKQIVNSITQPEIKNIFDNLKKRATVLYKTNNNTYMMDIQDFIIVSLYYLIPPRRALDFTEFKIRNIDKEVDNYMDKDKFIFNRYKTAKTYGQQIVKIPASLQKIIKQWIKINPTEYLLRDKKGQKLNGPTLTQRFHKIFDKKISVNALRHSYLSDKYQDTIKIDKNLKNDMTNMGSSIGQKTTYIQTI